MDGEALNNTLAGLSSSIDRLNNSMTNAMRSNVNSIAALSEIIGTTLVAAITSLHSDFSKFSSDLSKQSREAGLRSLSEKPKPSALKLQAPNMPSIDLNVEQSIALSERIIELSKKQLEGLISEAKGLTGIYKEQKLKHVEMVKATIKSTTENMEGLKSELDYIAKIEAEKKRIRKEELKSAGFFQRMFGTISDHAKKTSANVSTLLGRATQISAGGMGVGSERSFNIGKSIQGGLSKITENVGKAMDSLAVAAKKLFIWFSIAAGTTALFVKAFNPALVENFLWTLKDLSAVIGEGLQPVLTAFTVVMRAVADNLVDIVGGLVPFFQSLGNVVVNFLTPIFMGLSNLIQRLSPLLNTIGGVLETLAGQFGIIIGQIIENLEPALVVVANLFLNLAYVVSAVLSVLTSIPGLFETLGLALAGFAIMLTVDGAIALAQFAAQLFAASSGLALLTGGLTVIIAGVIGGFTWLISKLFFAGKQVDKFGLTNKSQSMAARKAEYSSVQDISANLVKAAFSGSNLDRLKNIDINGQRQVELLEKIANKGNKAPQVAMAGGQPGAKA